VYAASGATLYGQLSTEDLPVRESHPYQPTTPFGVSKKVVIDYLMAYRELHAVEFCALALGNVYGPRQVATHGSGVVAAFAERLVKDEPVSVFGDGSQTRDFVFIDDVVDGFVRASARGGGLVCNIGTGRETSLNDLLATMASVHGVEPARHEIPARPGDVQRVCLDAERAGIQLGWRPWTELGDGVRAVLEFLGDRPG
jgi:UDP-glucose 4-epimerase